MIILYITIYLAIGLLFFNMLMNFKPPAYNFKDEKKQREYDKQVRELEVMVGDVKAMMASNAIVAIGTIALTAIIWPLIVLFGMLNKK